MREALDGLTSNSPGRHHKEQGVCQRRKKRGAKKTVGVTCARGTAGEDCRSPCQQQAQHVGQIVPGISHQRRRISNKAVGKLNHDKTSIQDNGDDKSATMIVRVAVMVMATTMRVSAVIVRVMM